MALPTKTRTRQARVTHFQSTINLASIDAATVDASNDIQVAGAKVGDVVVINWSNEAAAITINAYVSAANVVTVVAVNATAGAINADSADFSGCVIHR